MESPVDRVVLKPAPVSLHYNLFPSSTLSLQSQVDTAV